MLHGFWTQNISRVHMDHAKFCFKAVFKPFILQWKYSLDQNIKFTFLSSVISQLPRFLFSVCSAYSLSPNALEATCGFMDSWLIISFSQLNFDGPRLAVYKNPPLPCKGSQPCCHASSANTTVGNTLFSCSSMKVYWKAWQRRGLNGQAHNEKSILKTSGCLYNSEPWHAAFPSLFNKDFK